MKKFIVSVVLIVAIAAYSFYQRSADSTDVAFVAPTTLTSQPTNGVAISQSPIIIVSSASGSQTGQTIPVPTATPVSKPKGQYTDGTYKGSVADAYYGNVQVQVMVSGGQMVNVAFLQYPNDRATSRNINSQAMPILKSETIQSQSAQVDAVSGASDTSAAFKESLAVALTQAKS